MKKKLVVVGAGGYGRAVAEAALAVGDCELVGFVDDALDAPSEVLDYPILGRTAELSQLRDVAECAVVAIGHNLSRAKIQAVLEEVGFAVVSVIHPCAVLSPSATLGPGCTLMAGAVVGTLARLGAGVIVNSGAVIDHDCQVDDFSHLGVHASMAGGTFMGRRSWMKAGSVLGYGGKLLPDQCLEEGKTLKGLPV